LFVYVLNKIVYIIVSQNNSGSLKNRFEKNIFFMPK